MKRSPKLILSLAVILGIFLLGRLSLPGLGNFLVVEDQPQPSDLIVVLMGSGPDRMLGAVDLYRQGYAAEIVLVRNLVKGYEPVVNQGVKIPHDSELAREVAVQLGVPAAKVNILPGEALSTQAEALQVREYLKSRKEITSLIIVTSKAHSGRAKKIFVKALGSLAQEVRVTSCPTRYDDFNAGSWWQSREDLKCGVQEYLKLLNFYLREQFEL
ncbi:MAG: YdcF family protein [Desulfitobacteriaceae bacterium]|nr:YdcF family protein [Desulfitobacteriaceae bacterium]